MKKREIAEGVKKQPYFASVAAASKQDVGTRDMGELYPFLICGGSNTERYYFTHINEKRAINLASDQNILEMSQTIQRLSRKE